VAAADLESRRGPGGRAGGWCLSAGVRMGSAALCCSCYRTDPACDVCTSHESVMATYGCCQRGWQCWVGGWTSHQHLL
jgi:hypothetical protein